METLRIILETATPMENYVATTVFLTIIAITINALLFAVSKIKEVREKRIFTNAQFVKAPKKVTTIFSISTFLFILALIVCVILYCIYGASLRFLWLVFFALVGSGILTYPFKWWGIVIDADAIYMISILGKIRKTLYSEITEVRITVPKNEEIYEFVEIFSQGKRIASLNSGYQGYLNLFKKLKYEGLI